MPEQCPDPECEGENMDLDCDGCGGAGHTSCCDDDGCSFCGGEGEYECEECDGEGTLEGCSDCRELV